MKKLLITLLVLSALACTKSAKYNIIYHISTHGTTEIYYNDANNSLIHVTTTEEDWEISQEMVSGQTAHLQITGEYSLTLIEGYIISNGVKVKEFSDKGEVIVDYSLE